MKPPLLLLFLLQIPLFSQTMPTSYEEIKTLVETLDAASELLEAEVIGRSVQGRNLYALKFSSSRFGEDPSKIRVLIFAQQHGNEQSGKEGALLLASDLLKPENRYLFDRIDLALIPQMNPDGSEVNKRFNANGMDLNRNHLILTESETQALHRFFDKYLFEVSLDVHEYFPYGESWEKFGYRKNSEVTVGTTTNINISQDIRSLSDGGYLPFAFQYFKDRGFSSFTYCPGGPPNEGLIRHSTFDVNDGRQSLGIQHSFSFIQEGMNGKDAFVDNLKRRAEGQMTGMRALLDYAFTNHEKIKTLVAAEREKLLSPQPGQMVSIQSEHIADDRMLFLPVYAYATGRDTVIQVADYRPVVSSLYEVEKPLGYLIPKDGTVLTDWAKRRGFRLERLKKPSRYRIEQYQVTAIDTIDFEGDPVANPTLEVRALKKLRAGKYLYLPTDQLKGNLLVLALEPKSMLGLATYRQFGDLLKVGEGFSVLRITGKVKE
ncbi:MAG: M14 family zinc carboxypeptidase [Saprospiraceae bacterium]